MEQGQKQCSGSTEIKDLQPGFLVRSAVVMNGSEEIPSQLDDLNGDLKADELAFVMDIPAQSKKTLAITLSSAQADKTYPARVFAEMLIRDTKSRSTPPHSRLQYRALPIL